MIQRIYRCNECGKEVASQGTVRHLGTHGIKGKLEDNRHRLTVVDERTVPNPNSRVVQVAKVPSSRVPARVPAKVVRPRVIPNGSLVLHSTAIKLMQAEDGELFVVTPLADLLKRGE